MLVGEGGKDKAGNKGRVHAPLYLEKYNVIANRKVGKLQHEIFS
jgi:hypothetical protein